MNIFIILSLLNFLKIASFAIKISKAFGKPRFLFRGRKLLEMNAQGHNNGFKNQFSFFIN